MLNGLISPEMYYKKELTKEKLNTFIGHRFEQIISSNSPNGRVKVKSKACLDRTYLLATDDENAVICECKYTEDPFDEKQLKDLQDSALCVTQQNKSYIIFSKNGVSSGVEKHLKNLSGYSVVTLDDLFLSECYNKKV